MPQKVLFVGDTHGEFEALSSALAALRPDAAIVVGDFGYWRRSDFGLQGEGFLHDALRRGSTKVFFCDGNHENHRLLAGFVARSGWREPIEVAEGLFFCPRGSAASIGGHRILFAGGAYSVDKDWRTPGRDWFPEEDLSEEALGRILSRPDLDRFDTVVSHTCPEQVLAAVCQACGLQRDWIVQDATERRLGRLCGRLPNVRDWWFGHWHQARDFALPRCRTRFHMLAMTPLAGCYASRSWRRPTLAKLWQEPASE